MRKVVLVLVGGFCGTLARFLLAAPLVALAQTGLPGATRGIHFDILAVNFAGALAIGLVYGLSDRGVIASPDVRLALGTGFLGAFTTFSTLAYGGDQLVMAGAWGAGLLYLGGSLVLGFALAHVGYAGAGLLARGWPRPVSAGRPRTQARAHARSEARPQRPAWVAAVWRQHELDASDQDMARWTAGPQQRVEERRAHTDIPDEVRE